jgi:hypothetical protein
MNNIEMILYSLDIIGATITSVVGLFLMLMCIVRREKEGIWIFGILTFILVLILFLVSLAPLKPFPSYLFGSISLIIFFVGLVKLPNIIGISSIENK